MGKKIICTMIFFVPQFKDVEYNVGEKNLLREKKNHIYLIEFQISSVKNVSIIYLTTKLKKNQVFKIIK